jgi:hypothetical protein
MSTAEGIEGTDATEVTVDTTLTKWSSVVLASLAAGVVMGIPMQFVMGIMPTVGVLYGFESLAAGWVAHLFHSVVFGVVFAGVVSLGPLKKYITFPGSVGVGVGYGVALWLFGSVIAMPLWLEAAGMGGPGVPNISPMSLVGHVAYGVLLGGLFPAVHSVARDLRVEPSGGTPTWTSAAAAGFVAGLFMTAILHFVMELMPVIAALYGLEGAAAGLVMHTFHSVVFAVVFAGVFSLPVLRRAAVFPTSVVAATVYGVGVWVFGSVYAMPLWLQSIGFEYAPEAPNIAPMSLLAHVVYGAVLGVVYPVALYALNEK